MNSYIGKILFVDLTTGESEVRTLSEETVRAFPAVLHLVHAFSMKKCLQTLLFSLPKA